MGRGCGARDIDGRLVGRVEARKGRKSTRVVARRWEGWGVR